jgi:hypothetical protein
MSFVGEDGRLVEGNGGEFLVIKGRGATARVPLLTDMSLAFLLLEKILFLHLPLLVLFLVIIIIGAI